MSEIETVEPDLRHLTDDANSLITKAVKAGADAADIVVSKSRSLSITARLGQIENTGQSENDSVSLRVFRGRRVASVATKAGRIRVEGDALIERAIAMANSAPEDPFAQLTDADRLADSWPDLDMFDHTHVSADALSDVALTLEQAALDTDGITNSNGASAGFGMGGMVLVTSNGFAGAYLGTRHSRSVSVVAGTGTAMQRDYDYDSRTHLLDMRSPQDIGKAAAQYTLQRLNPRKVATRSVPVLFDKRISASLLGHLAGAVNGAAIARGSSFLKERLGQQIFRADVTISDDPLLPRRAGSRPFDADGLSLGQVNLVENGVLKNWLLDGYSARELDLPSNGRAATAGSGTRPSATNLWMEPGKKSPAEIISSMKNGLIVTDFIGHGANLVTGDYSRGVSGFWVENGEIAFPVSEMTLAGSLPAMFAGLIPAADLEIKGTTNAPSLYLEGLTLAGR